MHHRIAVGLALVSTTGLAEPPADPPPAPSADAQRYLSAIDKHSELNGPCDSSLAEMMFGLGHVLQQEGNHPGAVEAFKPVILLICSVYPGMTKPPAFLSLRPARSWQPAASGLFSFRKKPSRILRRRRQLRVVLLQRQDTE